MTTLLESSKNYTYTTIDNASDIAFPVYHLKSEPLVIDGIVFVEGKAYDDRNVKAKTLGARRLNSPLQLSKLHTAYTDIVSMLKDNKSYISWFIDRYGRIIKYQKTRFEKLVCHRIVQVLHKKTYSLIIAENLNFVLEVPRPPISSYIQVLYYKGMPWKLYDYYLEPIANSTKKV